MTNLLPNAANLRHRSCINHQAVIAVVLAVALLLALAAPALAQTGQPTTVYTTRSVFMRNGPGMGFRVLATLPGGEELTVLSTEGIWYRVKRADGTEGWVSGSFLSANPPGSGGGGGDIGGPLVPKPPINGTIALVNSPMLNVRQGPGLNFASIGTVRAGEPVAILGSEAQWRLIRTAAGLQGWVNGFYLTPSITAPIVLPGGPAAPVPGPGAPLGGPLVIRQIAFSHAVRDPARAGGAIVTMRIEFTGGSGPFTISSDGFVKATGLTPATRPEGSAVVGSLTFTEVSECSGTMVHTVTLTAASGQSVTQGYYVSPVVCPN
jgi:SH3-like domain-containing protein